MITLENLNGSGTFQQDKVISYSYSEDASPLEPSNLQGGAGQVSVTVIGDEGPRGTQIAVNNNIQVTDSEFGVVTFRARQINIGEASATISGETIQYRLNSTRTAAAVGGNAATLLSAIIYYCGLVDIVPSFATNFMDKLGAISVNFPGWTGNVWEHLKMLCAAVPLDEDDNTFMEMYIEDDQLWFREGATTSIDLSEYVIDKSLSIDSYDAAKEVEVFNYNTSYGVNKVVQEQAGNDTIFTLSKNATFSDSMQVNAGETLVKRFKINASLTEVKQPEVVASIATLPFPETHEKGQYVVVGYDDYRINPNQWTDQGGKLEVRLTENFDEIEVIITAPPSVEMPTADGELQEVTFAPYKIGVESSGDTDYPAIYLVGTGVFFNKTSSKFVTGASEDYVAEISSSSIDNPFITNRRVQVDRGVAAAQAIMGPKMEISGSIATGVSFGENLGSIFSDYDGKFRASNFSYSTSSVSFTARKFITIADFNSAWSGATISDFNTTNSGLSFDEFATTPLVRN
jgi:hypothetical protein